MITTIACDGGLVLRPIPKPTAAALAPTDGTRLEIGAEDDRLVVRPVTRRPSLDELWAGIAPGSRPEATFDGGPRGRVRH
jgi:virulence-associated protein VagC